VKLLRYRDERGGEWADIIDMLTLYPEARRGWLGCLERSMRWKDAEITRIRVWNGGVRGVDSHAKPEDSRRSRRVTESVCVGLRSEVADAGRAA